MLRVNSSAQHLAELTLVSGLKGRPKARSRSVSLVVGVTFIGDASQDWDKCLLVRYPSRQHFLAMMANAAYREALVHRYAGLERTILLQMQG